jgi:hypothetical protein
MQKYNIDTSGQYELIAIAAGLHDAFAADPQLTQQQGLSIIHNTQAQLATWRAGAGANATPSETYQKALSLFADVTSSESAKAAANIGKDLLAFAPASVPEDDWRSINAFQAAEFSVDRARETEVLTSVYDDALSSSAFQSALDQGLGPKLKGLTSESAVSILDHNPALSTGLGVANLSTLISNQGESVQLSLGDLQNDLNSRIGDLANVVHDDGTLLHQMNQQQADIRAYLADAAAQQQAAQATQRQQKLDQLRIEAADAAFQVFGKLVGGRTGSQIAQTGQVAVKIASDISDFVNNTSKLSTGLGAAVLTGNLLGAALNLGSIFGPGPSELEIVSQQLTQLSNQIDDLQKDMDTRFDRIDNELGQL